MILIKPERSAHMKIGVSSYSFSRLVKKGALRQKDVISKAKEMGFDAIEFSSITVPEGEQLASFAEKLRDEAIKVDIPIINYTIGADFLNSNEGSWEAEAMRLEKEVDIARILGSSGMRHDATKGFPASHIGARSFDDALPILIKACRRVTEYASRSGIRTMVENHGFFCQDSERMEKLVCGVNDPNFGLLIDIGNFVCVDEDPEKAVGRLLPYVSHIHVKDFHTKRGTLPDPGTGWFKSRGGNYIRGAVIGHGDVPVVQCLRMIMDSGYDGVISVEFEGLEDVLEGISIGRDNLIKYISSLSGRP
jgi:sugar phosphate isomerase/epimerase